MVYRLLPFCVSLILFHSVNAQVWKGVDTIHRKRSLQLGLGVHSGIYKIAKEETDYKGMDWGVDVGVEARAQLNLTSRLSVSLGFIRSRKETRLTVFDFEPELYNIQNISSQIPIRVNYSFLSKSRKPILDVSAGISRVFSKYTTQFEYIDFFRLSNPSLPSTIGPYYTQTITHKRNDFSLLVGLQRPFLLAKNFHFVAFAEYEYLARAVAFNPFFNQHLPNKPAFEPNLKLRPTSLKLGIYFLL